MFEYLMPLLVMPNYDDTLLDHACKAAVRLQIEYGNSRGVPWGISESGFNQDRCASNLSIPRLWRAGAGFETGPGRRPGHRALCHGAGADGGAAGSVRESAAPGSRWTRRRLWILRGGRLHAVAPAAG